VALERINVGRPEAAERIEPRIHLHQRLRPDPVHTSLGIDAGLHNARFAQYPKVLGYRRLR
jgi:hypothetical protein